MTPMKSSTGRRNTNVMFGICLACLAACADAESLHVPAQFATIQGAIDAAANGDDIVVASGTYHEIINFRGKAIHLHSADGAAETMIDGTGLVGSVVTCESGEEAATILEGFTVSGGTGRPVPWPPGDTIAGGMYNSGSSPSVTGCMFVGNRASNGGGMYNINAGITATDCVFAGNFGHRNDGGGMFNMNSSPTIRRCLFFENSAQASGAGMFNRESSPTVVNCTFRNNRCLDPGSDEANGGGMCNERQSDPTVVDCLFEGNQANLGGGMSNSSSDPTIIGCRFVSNIAEIRGGAMFNDSGAPSVVDCVLTQSVGGAMYNYSSRATLSTCAFLDNEGEGLRIINSAVRVARCVFAGNADGAHIEDGGSPFVNCVFRDNSGRGMVLFDNAGPSLTNCTFTRNLAGGLFMSRECDPTVTNCVIWSNSAFEVFNDPVRPSEPEITFSDIRGGYPGVGNIDADPLFVDAAAGDLRLGPDSPCIDAGSSAVVQPFMTTDLDGLPRFHDDPFAPDTGLPDPARPELPIVDMGAHEFQGNSCAADWNNSGTLDSDDYITFLNDFLAGTADFNSADATDSQDFFDFVDAFFVGCGQ